MTCPGLRFLVEVYLDDGAVVYLNGGEICRLFMAALSDPDLQLDPGDGLCVQRR